MAMETTVVLAHAMGRTLVIPPQQHLYLLQRKHKDKHETKEHNEMGFEDFFDLTRLLAHKGTHVITMSEFLEQEGVVGGLHGKLPPGNSTTLAGGKLWRYLESVCIFQINFNFFYHYFLCLYYKYYFFKKIYILMCYRSPMQNRLGWVNLSLFRLTRVIST
jgi:hypothetical protein